MIRRRVLLAAVAATILMAVVRAAVGIPHGLRGDYFTDSDRRSPVFSQLDTDFSKQTLAAAWRTDEPDAFTVGWHGYLVLPGGVFQFATTSDDPVRLMVDGVVVLDNPGAHGVPARSNPVGLGSGPHAVVLDYLQRGVTPGLQWTWGRGGGDLQPVPGWMLSVDAITYRRALASHVVDWLWWIAVGALGVTLLAALLRRATGVLRRPAVAFLLLFFALSIVQTWPLALDPAHQSRNDNGDTLLNEWTIAWVAHQLPRAPLHLFDGNMFYPERATLAYAETLMPQALMVAPLLWLGASPVLAYNLLLIAGYALTGWATFLLLARWTGDRVAALAGGIIVGFSAHTIARMPHMQAQHAEFLPLALLALDRVFDQPRIRRALMLAVWFALQALASFYLLVMTAVALVVSTAVRPREWTGRRGWRVIAALAGSAAFAGLLLLPFLLPYYRHSTQLPGFTRPLSEAWIYVASWRDYLTSPGRIPRTLWGSVMSLNPLYPGAVATLLAAVAIGSGVAFRDPRARMCVAFGICGVVLSFGPAVPGYAWLYNTVPLFHGVRAVSRFGYLALVAIGLLAAYGFARLRASLRGTRWATPFAAAILVLVFAEPFAVPIWYMEYEGIPRIYDRLAAQPPVIVAEMPMPIARGVFVNAPYVFDSTAHWQPLVNGYSGYIPASYIAHVEQVKNFPAADAIAALRTMGVSFVMVHRDQMAPAALAALDQTTLVEKIAQQRDMILYRIY